MTKKHRAAKAGIIGAVAGVLAGIFLLAPKGAKQSRATVRDTAGHTRREAEKRLKQVYSELQSQLSRLKTRAKTLTGKAKSDAQGAQAKVEQLLAQTKELITTLREGDVEVDEQVKRVMVEAKKLKSTLVKKAKGGKRGPTTKKAAK